MDTLGKNLGERIVNARNKKGLSQDKFADQLGVSRQMVSRWELNTAVPRMSRMEKICEVLGLTANELINGKSDVATKENENINKTSQEEIQSHYQQLRFKAFLKRTALILIKIIIVLLILYIAYTSFKFIVLKNVINKVSKYENWNNYYCKVRSFDENEKESIKEIWYKDGVYKIVESMKINDTDVKTILLVDFNNKCRYQIDEQNKLAMKRNGLSTYSKYEKGSLMYSYFPIEINKSSNYLEKVFKIYKVIYYKKDNKHCFGINNTIIYLDKNTYLPIMSTIKQKNQGKVKETLTEYEIKLDIVQDEDIKISNEYTVQ